MTVPQFKLDAILKKKSKNKNISGVINVSNISTKQVGFKVLTTVLMKSYIFWDIEQM
jgi:hypothetical protein